MSKKPATLVSAVLLLLVGMALAVGGTWLLLLGGSAYYLLAGLTVSVSGVLYSRGSRLGERLFALVLLATLAWALVEAGLNPWALLARTFALAVAGIWVSLPWVRRGLRDADKSISRNAPLWAALVILAVLAVSFARSQAGIEVAAAPNAATAPLSLGADAADTDWGSYGNALDGQRFARLSQINVGNARELQPAWVHRSGELKLRKPVFSAGGHSQTVTPGFRAEATPIKVGNIVYTCGTYADIYAIDAQTGKEVWRSPTPSDTRHYYFFTCRGVAFYRAPDVTGPCAGRILVAAPGGMLRAVDALTGAPCEDFGRHGVVSLLDGMGQADPIRYKTTSPPTIVNDVAIVGSMISDNYDADMPSGVVKAYDPRTGALRWAWDMGAPDRVGPPPAGQSYTRGTPNAWGVFAADPALGLAYVATGNASPDFLGMHRRPFDEKYSTSVVALNIGDGRPRWSFQTTHHDLWDYDLSAQPVLMDWPRSGGGTVPAVLQATKRGDIFVLDRRTGRPLIAPDEVSAPLAGAMPGERLSRTQPISGLSLIPPTLVESDMWGVTPIDQMICRIRFRQMRYKGIFTPPGLTQAIQEPGQVGTIDWGGVSVDGDRKVLIANTSNVPWTTQQVPRSSVPDPDHSPWPQRHTPFVASADPFFGPLSIPCNQPPWGDVVAIDLKTQRTLWRRVVGTARDNGPLNISSGLPLLVGQPSFGGTIITQGGLVFMAATLDRYLRALDIRSGEVVWQARLPAGAQASPMTYMAGGRQFVVITAGGHAGAGTKAGDYTIAYALPRSRSALH